MLPPPQITSNAPKHLRRGRPIPINVAKVKKEFTKLSELFAEHAKDMLDADVVAFSQYATQYKQKESRYENMQQTIISADAMNAFDRFTGNDDGLVYSEHFATMASLGSDMQYYVTQMTDLIEDFLPSDDDESGNPISTRVPIQYKKKKKCLVM